MFDWDDLRIFLAVARMKKLSPASRSLGIDATTVSRRITRLEEKLGARLFEQSGGEKILTQRGTSLLRHAESVEGAALDAISEFRGERHGLSGHVRLSVAEGFGTWILAPALPRFHDEYPGISLDIVTASGFLNPSKREADMAVMLARPQSGYLTVQRLGDYRLHLYASREYLMARGTPTSRSDLASHTLVGYVPEFLFTPELDYLDEISTGLQATLRSSSINIQRRLVLDGAGIGVLPDFMIAADPRFMRLLPKEAGIKRSFWLVTHRDLANVSRISAISNLLRGLFSNSQ
ncbi:MAG: LysR family transcriptional regulator [Sphingobium sp.]|uniref:LysR family transcriptional regulator n=1 Tax=Sphingobium sp. TaxID=1912891 RepID=UPI000DB48E75|nr:LysR family transcriptional regulator [Sphingobium sp.]PZU10490.1 MAG: LysR family transcriptional regulator [Sphingobium sp.]